MIFGLNNNNNNTTPATQIDPKLKAEFQHRCQTSMAAIQGGDPKHNKNYRNNPALLLSLCNTDTDTDNTTTSSDQKCHNILIDAGKTFREAALRWFPEHQIQTLDAIILTHHHMDAAGGLDDVRGFQKLTYTNNRPKMTPMPLYLSHDCLADVSQRFPWLFPNQQATPYTSGTHTLTADKPMVARHVASFDIQPFTSFTPMTIHGLEITPLPVWHGEDLISYGFAFTLGKNKQVLYISDISRMPDDTLQYIRQKYPNVDVLIIDSLMPEKSHAVHFSLQQALVVARQVGAKQTYIVGINCDAFSLHDDMNAQLQREQDIPVQLAHDGQILVLE